MAVFAINLFVGLAYLAAYIVSLKVSHHAVPSDPSQIPAIVNLYAQLVAYVPMVIFVLFVLPRLSRVSFAALGFARPTARDVLLGAGGTIAMWIGVVVFGSTVAALTHRHDTESAVALLKSLKGPVQLGLFFLVACVLAPIVEELWFRALIFNSLTKYMSITAAAVVSGILFGLVHAIGPEFLGQSLTVGIPLAVGGFVLAYVYAISRCFWSNVLTHACFNAINVIALVFFHVT